MPGLTQRGASNALGRLAAAAFLPHPWPLAAAAVDSPVPSHVLSPLNELFWALLLLGGFALAGVVWVGAIRRRLRGESRALQEREANLDAWYRDLFENAHDILFVLDEEGRWLSLNRAGEGVLGLTRQDWHRRSLSEWLPPERRAAFSDQLQQLRQGSDTGYGEWELVTGEGRRVVLRVNLRRQALPGRAPRIQGLAWDVTDQRRAEAALRESEQRLRHSLEERIRIGRDLHDGIIQSIYAVGLNLGECRRLLLENPAWAHPHLERSVADLNAVIREVRSFISGLEPEALKGSEFRTAVEGVLEGLRGATGASFAAEIDSDTANRLSARQAADLLQIVREAVSNAVRHSGGRYIQVRLCPADGGGARLEVRDDGVGLSPTGAPGGLGLRNIEHRARDLGARQDILTVPNQGTTLRVEIPKDRLNELD